MSATRETAFLTGGASGIGRAVTTMLVSKGIKVYIADRDIDGARAVCAELNPKDGEQMAWPVEVDVSDWDSQRQAFEAAEKQFGRIDYVFPIAGIGERRSFPNRPHSTAGYERPDLKVMEIDANGVIYTVSLAVQHFRRQGLNKYGFKGKIVAVASVCGFYIHATIPLYTAAKHAIVGFVRSFGTVLAEEKITLNAICPNKIRTNISTAAVYEKAEKRGVLVPMQQLLDAFEALLGDNDASAQCYEIAPKIGCRVRPPVEFINEESRISAEMTYERSHYLHEVIDGE